MAFYGAARRGGDVCLRRGERHRAAV